MRVLLSPDEGARVSAFLSQHAWRAARPSAVGPLQRSAGNRALSS
jgi:hypothetical protein